MPVFLNPENWNLKTLCSGVSLTRGTCLCVWCWCEYVNTFLLVLYLEMNPLGQRAVWTYLESYMSYDPCSSLARKVSFSYLYTITFEPPTFLCRLWTIKDNLLLLFHLENCFGRFLHPEQMPFARYLLISLLVLLFWEAYLDSCRTVDLTTCVIELRKFRQNQGRPTMLIF